jgi:hypothetical protein
MNPLESLLTTASILLLVETVVKTGSDLVRVFLLYHGFAYQALECIKTNRNIQELTDFHLAEKLSSELQQQGNDEGQNKESKRKEDLKSMLQDPDIFEKFEQYTREFLRLKEERERVLAVVDTLQNGTVAMDNWDEIESTILALVHLDHELFDLLIEKIFLKKNGSKKIHEHLGNCELINDARVGEEHLDISLFEKVIQESSLEREKGSSAMSPLASEQPSESVVQNRAKENEVFLSRVLDPGLIEMAAKELIKDHPDRKEKIISFVEKVNLKSELARQLDTYKFWTLVDKCSSSGAQQGDVPNETEMMEIDELNPAVPEQPHTRRMTDVESSKDELISIICNLLKKKEADLEKLGAEFGGGKQWMIGEVEQELE